MEVGDPGDDLDDVLALDAEDVLGDGLDLDLALGGGSAHWLEQETKRLLSELIPQSQ